MSVTDLIEETLYALSSNKVRSGLTILGIVVGIASVILLTSLGEGSATSLMMHYLVRQAAAGKVNALEFGFARCGLDHIIALVHPDNLASRRVAEKCGMVYVDTLHLWGIDLMRLCVERKAFPLV